MQDYLFSKTYDCVSDLTQEEVHPCQTIRPFEKDRFNYQWWGANSIDEVKQIIEHGWPEGLEKARKDLSVVQLPRLRNVRRRRARASFGDDIDMQRVYAGDLDRAWGTTHREIGLNQTHQRIVLVCNLSTSAHIKSERCFWRGAATTIIADTLVNSGRSVKIAAFEWGTNTFKKGGNNRFIVTVKDYDEPMLPEKVIAVLGLVGFFRYYGFKQMMSAPKECSSGLGHPVHGKIPPEIEAEYPCDFIMIDQVWNQDATQQLLNSLEGRLTK